MKKPSLIAEDVTIGRRALLIAMDETGHEEFQGQDYFGFGGVAGFGVMAFRADRAWTEMRNDRFQGHDGHASGKMMSPEQIEAVTEFFRANHLPRFAYLIERPPIDLGDGVKLLQG